MDIDDDMTVRHLRAVGCAVSVDGDTLTALAPTWRPDLTDPYDLVEEVARIAGYVNVPSVLPAAPAGRGLTRAEAPPTSRPGAGRGRARRGEDLPVRRAGGLRQPGPAADDERRRTVDIANPLSEEEPSLTTTLLPGLLRTAARNVGRGRTSLGIFETAAVFLPTPDGGPAPILDVDRRPTAEELEPLFAAVPDQPRHLGVVLTGEREPGLVGHRPRRQLGRCRSGRP